LKEICEGQLQFAQAGSNKTLPVFGGTKGAEWTSSLMDLKNMFLQYLDKIKQLDYDILDVKITAWHDNYGQEFKENVKSIEVIYTTII
jgi:dynein heavy chain